MDVFKISTTNQKHKQTNSKAKIKEPRSEKRLGPLANELKRPMSDTIFKRNLNKFLCDLSQVNFLYFYHSSKFLCFSLFLDFISLRIFQLFVSVLSLRGPP